MGTVPNFAGNSSVTDMVADAKLGTVPSGAALKADSFAAIVKNAL